MYPYQLGWHIKTQQFCRIPIYCIPVGTVKVTRYRRRISSMWINPYRRDRELDDRYFSIPRAQDIEYALQRQEESKGILEKI